jgi:hypothetical protein
VRLVGRDAALIRTLALQRLVICPSSADLAESDSLAHGDKRPARGEACPRKQPLHLASAEQVRVLDEPVDIRLVRSSEPSPEREIAVQSALPPLRPAALPAPVFAPIPRLTITMTTGPFAATWANVGVRTGRRVYHPDQPGRRPTVGRCRAADGGPRAHERGNGSRAHPNQTHTHHHQALRTACPRQRQFRGPVPLFPDITRWALRDPNTEPSPTEKL